MSGAISRVRPRVARKMKPFGGGVRLYLWRQKDDQRNARCFKDKDAPARRKARSVGDQSAGRGVDGPAPGARRPDLRGRFLFPISPRLPGLRLSGEKAPGACVRPSSPLNGVGPQQLE